MQLVGSFADTSRFVALRRDIHAHPEPDFEEHRTSPPLAARRPLACVRPRRPHHHVLAPAGMPKAEVEKLNTAIDKALADPAVQQRLTNLGVEAGTMSADEFRKLLRADYEAAGVLVKASGARIE